MHQHQVNHQPPVFWTNQHSTTQFPNHSNVITLPPPPFPDFRKKKRKDGTCTCLLIIFLLVLLALAGVGLGTYKLFQLQKELDQIKEFSEVEPSVEKLMGLENHQSEKKDVRLAAHLTPKEGRSMPLAWEDTVGRAFTAGILYKNRGLVVNQTGLHFIYSSVYFRGTTCLDKELSHVVYKKPIRYLNELKLMENVEYHYCANKGKWGRHSFLGAVFNLSSSDIIYVNVSDVTLISPEESRTFFGIYKL
ncbi:tumor necrosis factor ligand superfamily member 6 [Pelobates fuscus]|uniref:tumor necrosis factor ligand superfamily member 6 n=1 Tax=Pelobates fuscus TaxID=191477 RepID=UPI002FE4DABA